MPTGGRPLFSSRPWPPPPGGRHSRLHRRYNGAGPGTTPGRGASEAVMEISARVSNTAGGHAADVATAGSRQSVAVAAKAQAQGRGSAINGGEFLMLALATCYCNDLYREAARLGIAIDGCEVVATARFEGAGLAAEDVRYAVRVDSIAPTADIERLVSETDRVAEVHNTLRGGCAVTRVQWPLS